MKNENEPISQQVMKGLLEELFVWYGYDFGGYVPASMERRVNRIFRMDGFSAYGEFRYRLQNDPEYFSRFVQEVTVNVTEMFRDPGLYQVLRRDILPVLAPMPFIRIWHAGCSTGEEVYSMAILLAEAGLLERSLLYGTDINPLVIDAARKGMFPISQMQQYSENYIQSGGIRDFSTYYTANYHRAIFNASLSSRMIFSTHNLVSDYSFNEFQLILCRNVLIYFERPLQNKVLRLLDDSMEHSGFLVLGGKESLKFSPLAGRYAQIGREKIWRKIRV